LKTKPFYNIKNKKVEYLKTLMELLNWQTIICLHRLIMFNEQKHECSTEYTSHQSCIIHTLDSLSLIS
jgi:hypothetical protein